MSNIATSPRSTSPHQPENAELQQKNQEAQAQLEAKEKNALEKNGDHFSKTSDANRIGDAQNENTPTNPQDSLTQPSTSGVTVSPSIPQASQAESTLAINSLEAGQTLLAKGDWRQGIPKLNEAIRTFDSLAATKPFAAEEGRLQAFSLRTQAHLLQLSQAQSPERREQVMNAIDQGFAEAKARLDKKMQAQSLPVNEQALYAEQQQKLQQLEGQVKSLQVGLKYTSAAPLKDLADLRAYSQERAGRRLKALTRIWERRAEKAIKSSGLEVGPEVLTQHRLFDSHAARLKRDFGIDPQVFENIVAGTLKREKIEFIMNSHGPEAWDQVRTDLKKIGVFDIIPEAVLKAEFVQKKAEVIINKADVGAWGQVRADLEKFGAFDIIPEAAFKAHFIQKKLQSTLQKAQDARARVGYYMLPATRHEMPDARNPYSKARSDDALATRDLKVLNNLMGGKLDLVTIDHNLQKVTTAGRDAWHKHYSNLKKEDREAELNRSAGQKALDILKGGVGALNHTIESTLSLTVGNLAYLGGVDNAGNYLTAQREFFNEYAMGGSIFGGDKEFSNMKGDIKSWGGAGRLWSENFKTVNPLVHAGNVIMTPLNLADIPYDAYQKWVVETGSGVQLSEEEFRKLQAEDSLLRAGKASLNISKFALAAAITGKMGKMTNIQLAKAIGVSSAFGTGGALAQELKSDQDFDTLRFAENSLAGAANSQMFMAGIGAMSTAWAKLRAGNAVKGPLPTNPQELKTFIKTNPQAAPLLRQALKEAQLVARSVDATDALGDLSQSLATADFSSGNKAVGSALQAGLAILDAFDGRLAIGHLTPGSRAKAKINASNLKAPNISIALPSEVQAMLEDVDAQTKEQFNEILSKNHIDDSTFNTVEALRRDNKISDKQADAVLTALRHFESQLAENHTVLVLDTPLTKADGTSLNQNGMTLVIDHHAAYAPSDGTQNTGAQVIGLMRQASEKHPSDTDAALADFRKNLFGDGVEHLTLTADNLADAAEVMAMLKSEPLQRRIIEDAKFAAMLTESGQFTDFEVFAGDAYEKANTSAQSKQAIAISKAIMMEHSRLLREADIVDGDRFDALGEAQAQKLLNDAVKASEKIWAEVLTKDFNADKMGRVGELAAEFDTWRGGPEISTRPDGGQTSFANGQQAHADFKANLLADLKLHLSPEKAAQAEKLINEGFFGHQPVSTGNLFADWGASPMINTYAANPRALKLEIAGDSADARGKKVIIAKSGQQDVDVGPLAKALNTAAKKERTIQLRQEGKSTGEIKAELEKYAPFTSRGTDLLFSFGGHPLSRAQVLATVGEVLLTQEKK